MTRYTLPMPADELAARLSRALAPGHDPVVLSVSRVALVPPPEAALALLLALVAEPPGGTHGHWEVTVPVDPVDLGQDVRTDAFVLTVRANLEEWWAMKDREAGLAMQGRRTG